MQKESKSLVWGIILIVIGFLFLGNNLYWFDFDWAEFWHVLMIGGGVLFWLNWFTHRKEIGLLMPGTILLSYGLMFQYCALNGWYWMEDLWPVFLLGPGLGFFFMYLLGKREKGLLIPASVLSILGILFMLGREPFHYFWPLLLIAIGIFLLFNSRKKEDNKISTVEPPKETEKDAKK